MIGWGDVYKVVVAMAPLYVALILGYGSVKWLHLFSAEQCHAIDKLVCYFIMPFYAFQFIANSNPFKMNLRFICADLISRGIVLTILGLWLATHRKKGGRHLDWCITSYSLSSLTNALVIGVPLIEAMYGPDGVNLIVQASILQSTIWLTVLLFLLEVRKTGIDIQVSNELALIKANESNETGARDVIVIVDDERKTGDVERNETGARDVIVVVGDDESNIGDADKSDNEDADEFMSTTGDMENNESKTGEIADDGSKTGDIANNGSKTGDLERNRSKTGDIDDNETKTGNVRRNTEETEDNAKTWCKCLLKIVVIKLVCNPNVCASVIGFTWALLASRWHFHMPSIMAGSISVMSRATTGVALFSMGLFMALQKKVIACGVSLTLYGFVLRFLVGPAAMAIGCVIVGLHGQTLHVAIIQAAMPQAIISFIYAHEYELHANVISTAVIFGMLVSLPVLVGYYAVLGFWH